MMNFKENWRLYLSLAFVVIISEAIGQHSFVMGIGVIVIFPMLYAMVFGSLLTLPQMRFLKLQNLTAVTELTMLGVALIVARIGVSIGPNLNILLNLSWALFLQELGHFLGTVLFGTPVAVLLGLGRETIGSCFSLAREYALAIITEKYGIDSSEGRGVVSQYFFGTLFGAVYFGLFAGWVDSLNIFDPLSLAMASGVGSVSMMTASSGALIASHPELKDQIIALSGIANLLTVMGGLYFSLYISLPATEAFYKFLRKLVGHENE